VGCVEQNIHAVSGFLNSTYVQIKSDQIELCPFSGFQSLRQLKHFHKPPIIIYQGVAPPVHVYEKSSGGYSPVAQAKSGNTVSLEDQPKAIKAPALERKSDIIVAKDLSRKEAAPVAQARSTQINVASSSAVVGASVSVDEGFEILKKGTVESIDPKAD
jgi:hypothetical protein